MPPAQDGIADRDWVTIARLTRTRGNRGELSAVSMSGHVERFAALESVTLFGGQAFPDSAREYQVERVWEHGGRLVFQFAGIESISDAEHLRGAEVRIPVEDRFPLPEGEYYHSDLVGCELVDAGSGAVLGRVKEFRDEAGNGLLEVDKQTGGTAWVPFHRDLCVEIDVERRRIAVDLPAGLLELND